ncbi:Alpha-ribazole phosphatase [compost metagenome]
MTLATSLLRLYIVRHGESIANANGILESRNDSPLSDLGREQTVKLAEKLRDVQWRKAFSSPSLRASSTAELIVGPVDVETLTDLAEMDVPFWEGLTWEEIEDKFPADYEAFRNDPEHYKPATGETFQEVAVRTSRLLAKMQRDFAGEGGDFLLVTHSVIVNMLLISAAQKRIDDIKLSEKVGNASMRILRWNGEQFEREQEV